MCLIFKLPDEILVAIFKINAPSQSLDVFSRYTEFLPLLLVCKRWRSLCDPLLVRKLEVGHGGWHPKRNKRTTGLLVNFFRNPSLCRHVRILSIRMPIVNPLDLKYCTPIADLISLCALVREIYLKLEWTSITSPIAHAISGLPGLKILRVAGDHSDGVLMRSVIRYFSHPSIRYVCVEGLSERDTMTPSCVEVIRAAGTSKVTKLCLFDPIVGPRITKYLVGWPQRLEELTMTFAELSRPFACYYRIQSVQEILDVHRESLRYIRIGPIYGAPRSIPDFSAYPSLRKLQVPAYGVFAETPAVISSKVSASYLEEMIIDFETDERHINNDCTEISKVQVYWLSEFGDHHRRLGNPTKNLRAITVQFTPKDWVIRGMEGCFLGGTMEWPWQYLIEAKEILSTHHISLEWNEPCCTREQWPDEINEG